MIEQWQELKETITEMRDNDGTGTQQEVCKFLANYMDILEKQMQEPCEDAISRQAAIDAFERFIHELGIEDEPYNYGEIALSIQNVPPVTPQPKIGQWIQVESDKCKCDQCEVIQFITMYPYGRKNYCPNCGAKMQEVEV